MNILRTSRSPPALVSDLWQLPTPLLTKSVSAELEHNFYARCPPEKRSSAFRDHSTEHSNPATRVPTPNEGEFESSQAEEMTEKKNSETEGKRSTDESDLEHGKQKPPSASSKSKQPKQDSSLLMALHTTFFWQWWISGLLKLASGMKIIFFAHHQL